MAVSSRESKREVGRYGEVEGLTIRRRRTHCDELWAEQLKKEGNNLQRGGGQATAGREGGINRAT